jgi:ribose 1,5-bisphosphokinase PhnN
VAEIDARLRAAAAAQVNHPRLKTIDNSGTLAASGVAFMRLLAELQRKTSSASEPKDHGRDTLRSGQTRTATA